MPGRSGLRNNPPGRNKAREGVQRQLVMALLVELPASVPELLSSPSIRQAAMASMALMMMNG